MMKKLKALARRPSALAGGAVMLGVLAAALVTPALVAAQSSDGATDDDARPERTVQECVDRVGGWDAPRMTAFLDELVADGVVDQAQADEIERRLRSDAEDRCITRLLFDRGQAIAATADVTDTLESEVMQAMRDGGTLADYAAGHGVSEADLIAAIMAPSAEAAAELVAGGELEQAKADELLAITEERVTEGIHKTADDLPWLRRFGRHGRISDAVSEGTDRLAKLLGR
jgi:hypothetical protein